MKSTKPWRVLVNGEEHIEEAIKATTAVTRAMEHYLAEHDGPWYIHKVRHSLDRAKISIEPIIVSKVETVPKGTQLQFATNEGEK